MSSISNNPNPIGLDPTALYGDLQQVKKEGQKSIQNALTMLITVNATGQLPGNNATGAPSLSAPKTSLMQNVTDLTLKIGMLQDALNELMQAVSKNEIEGRLNDLKRENREQLDKIKTQLEEAEKAAAKRREADKKSNIFEAVGNWFKAVFDVVSSVITAIAAVGYAFSGNVVAAAGLFVASAALMASGVCNFALAIDATIRAAGGPGMPEHHKANLMKAAEILGYVALGASMIGGLSVMVSGIRAGAAMAGKELAKHGLESGRKAVMKEVFQAMVASMKELMGQSSKEVSTELAKKFAEQAMKVAIREGAAIGSREVAQEAARLAVREAVKDAMKAVMKPLFDMIHRLGIAAAIQQPLMQISVNVGKLEVNAMLTSAADMQRKADEAEAQAKAIQATIEMLRKVIEQLQKDLEDMLEAAMETVSVIFNAADEASESMKELMHFQTA